MGGTWVVDDRRLLGPKALLSSALFLAGSLVGLYFALDMWFEPDQCGGDPMGVDDLCLHKRAGRSHSETLLPDLRTDRESWPSDGQLADLWAQRRHNRKEGRIVTPIAVGLLTLAVWVIVLQGRALTRRRADRRP